MKNETITIVIPAFGDFKFKYWDEFVVRAVNSIHNQSVKASKIFIDVDSDSLSDARNSFGLRVNTDWIIFLDADDELSPNYIEEMLKGTGDIRVPSVYRYYEDGRIDTNQTHYKPKSLITGNYIVIGAMIRASLFKQLGGFHDYETLEDWDLWLRAEEAGAIFTPCPNAIYKAYKRLGSRNSNISFNEVLIAAKKRRGIK